MLLALGLQMPAHADVWGYIDSKGVAHFAAEKLDDRYELFFKGNTSFDTRDGLASADKPEPETPRSVVVPAGQAKLLAVALHIAQVQLLAKRAGKRCTVLFDEMIAELDHRHVSLVLTMLRRLESQVILTSVELPEALKGLIGKNSRVFHVKQGVIDAL